MKTLMLLLICSPCLADDLVYQSQTLAGTDHFFDSGVDTGDISAVNDVYTIDVQVSGPLAPNLQNALITPIAWTVTCQICSTPLSSSIGNDPRASLGIINASSAIFMFSTDSTGKVTAWNFVISGRYILPDLVNPSFGGFLNEGSETFSSGDSVVADYFAANAHEDKFALSAPKGTWTQSSLSNPAPPPAPTPPAPPTANVQLMSCTNTWIAPLNKAHTRLWPNANGTGAVCDSPVLYPGSWYAMATSNGGKSASYVTLASLKLGK